MIEKGLCPVKEVGDGDTHGGGHLKQAPRGYTVHTLFVFLDLLKGQAEQLSQLFLGQFQLLAPPPDALADDAINTAG